MAWARAARDVTKIIANGDRDTRPHTVISDDAQRRSGIQARANSHDRAPWIPAFANDFVGGTLAPGLAGVTEDVTTVGLVASVVFPVFPGTQGTKNCGRCGQLLFRPALGSRDHFGLVGAHEGIGLELLTQE